MFNRFVRSTNFIKMKKQNDWFFEEENQSTMSPELALALSNVKCVIPGLKSFVDGTVTLKSKDGFYVNIGSKYDGFLPTAEAGDIQVGQHATFWVISADNEESCPVISYQKALGWTRLNEHKESGEPLTARVFCLAKAKYNQRVKGVRVVFENGDLQGIRGFVPTHKVARNCRLEDLIGKEILVSVDEIDPCGGGQFGTLVLNGKKAHDRILGQQFADYSVGDVVKGKVRKYIKVGDAQSTGVLVDLSATVTGLMYEKQVTPQPGKAIEDVVPLGCEREFEIVRVDHKARKVWLSVRNLDRREMLDRIKVGQTFDGVVVRGYEYGYFVHIGADVNGLVHITQLNTFQKGKLKALAIGQQVKVEVSTVTENGHRVALRLLAVEPDSAEGATR